MFPRFDSREVSTLTIKRGGESNPLKNSSSLSFIDSEVPLTGKFPGFVVALSVNRDGLVYMVQKRYFRSL